MFNRLAQNYSAVETFQLKIGNLGNVNYVESYFCKGVNWFNILGCILEKDHIFVHYWLIAALVVKRSRSQIRYRYTALIINDKNSIFGHFGPLEPPG